MLQVLSKGGQEDKGENARLQCFVGAEALGDMIKTTLGPRGMDKLLQPMGTNGSKVDNTSVTNDGATILKCVYIDNPAAKVLIDVSKRQDQECGDGTTGVVVLAAELIKVADKLINKRMHPQTVIEGYRIALNIARDALNSAKFSAENDNVKLIEYLKKIAKTSLNSKILAYDNDHFANLVVTAITRLRNKNNIKLINILKFKGGSSRDSELVDGLLLEKRFANGSVTSVKNAKILLANTSMDADKIKIYGAKIEVNDYDEVASIEKAEREKMKAKVEKISNHNCNIFINRQLIYDYPQQLLRDKNIACIPHADFDGIERIAAATGAEIASTFNSPDEIKLGTCDLVEEILYSEQRLIKFTGCHMPETCTIILKGASDHMLDEAERALHDALAIVSQAMQEPYFITGGGSIEMHMALAIKAATKNYEGKQVFAMEAFADALIAIPAILAENGGYDSMDITDKLIKAHFNMSNPFIGINLDTGDIADMRSLGVFESYKCKLSQLNSASSAAEQLLRIDSVIKAPVKPHQ